MVTLNRLIIAKSTIYIGSHNSISCWSICVAQNYRILVSKRRFRKKKKSSREHFLVWLHGVEKNERFFFFWEWAWRWPGSFRAPIEAIWGWWSPTFSLQKRRYTRRWQPIRVLRSMVLWCVWNDLVVERNLPIGLKSTTRNTETSRL